MMLWRKVPEISLHVPLTPYHCYRLLFNFHPDTNIWVAFATGNNFRYHCINTICKTLGPEKSKTVSFFHVFTGNDMTHSSIGMVKDLHGIPGNHIKMLLWVLPTIWLNHATDTSIQVIWNLGAIYLHPLWEDHYSVNDLRHDMFSRQSKMMENIPPFPHHSEEFYSELFYMHSY